MEFQFVKKVCKWETLSINIPDKNCTIKKFLDALNLSITGWDVFVNGLPTSPEDILKRTDNIVLLQKKD